MTMIKVDSVWLYSFGGVCSNYIRFAQNTVVERLNTEKINEVGLDLVNEKNNVQWQEICVKTNEFTSCCQQGVIQISYRLKDTREYLIFGGVDSDYTK